MSGASAARAGERAAAGARPAGAVPHCPDQEAAPTSYTHITHTFSLARTGTCTDIGIHSFSHSFVHSFIRSFIHSFIHAFIHSFTTLARSSTVEEDTVLTKEQFKELLQKIDSGLRALPATAQASRGMLLVDRGPEQACRCRESP